MADRWHIPGHPVAICSTLRATEIPGLASQFDAALVLATGDELRGNYELRGWGQHGVECLHNPIPDLNSLDLLELHVLASWVASRVSRGERVLIQCRSGLRRGGTVAAAYLIATGVSFEDAVRLVRSAREEAIAARVQAAVLEAYDLLLRSLPEPKLSAVLTFGERYVFGRGRGHAAKVTQLTLKLWKLTAEEFGLGDGDRPPASLAAGSILHDIGVSTPGPGGHHERSYREILASEELKLALGEEGRRLAALVALHHRSVTDPRTDGRMPKRFRDLVMSMAAVLRIADALDRSLAQLVNDVDLRCSGGECALTAYYSQEEPTIELERAGEKGKLLEEVFGVRLRLRSFRRE